MIDDELTHTTRAGAGERYARKGWTTARTLADGLIVVATGDARIVEHRDEIVQRSVAFSAPIAPLGITRAGDVFVRRDDHVYVWRRANDTLTRVARVPRPSWSTPEPRVSPDGTHLAFQVATSTDVAIVCVSDGTEALPVRVVPRPLEDARFSLSNGGRWVLFVKDVSAQSGSGWTDYVIDRSPTGKHALTGSLPGDDAAITVSDDGDHVETEVRVTERFNPDDLP